MKARAVKVSSEEIAADTHFLASVCMIKDALALADPGSVAVLGCGRCAEIPVRLLNEKFDRVDLIDIDEAALDFVRAKSREWNDEKNGYHFYCADLSGLMTTVARQAVELVQNAVDPVACLEQLGVLLESTAPEFWEHPQRGGYDFVVCSGVLTQLQALLRESVEKIYLERFPHCASVLSELKSWSESVWNFARNLEDGFINHLGKLTKPSGIVYLSETVHVSWLTQVDEQSVSTAGSWIATRTSRLADYLSPSDTILDEQHWKWLRESREGDFWGRLYGVQSLVYRVD
jgi:hypothetical protein